jgi:VWFA-related protein
MKACNGTRPHTAEDWSGVPGRSSLLALVLALAASVSWQSPALLMALAASVSWQPTARAQDRQSAPQPAPQPAPVFRSGVNLVRMDVRAVDRDGRPITDLKPEDLEIVEGGRVRPIALFQHVAEPSGTYLEVARRTTGADISTNRGAPRGHLYVIVFDQNHITPGNEQRARMAAERFLKTRVRPGDRVALYALPGPGPHLSFTGDTRAVQSQLIAVRGALDKESFGTLGGMTLYEAFEITRGNDTVLQRVVARAASDPSTDLRAALQGARTGSAVDTTPVSLLQNVLRDNARTVVDRGDGETRAFLTLFAEVLKGLCGIEGRKAVVLISEGFFSDFVHADVERVAAAAAQAYAVVYSLDINRRGVDINQAEPAGNDANTEILDRIEPLGSLAAETSGELVTDAGSRLDSTFERIADQSLDYYVIGFESEANTASTDVDRYRRITINARRPGVTVRARTGYSFRDPVVAADRRRAIDTALAAPFPQQGLPVEVTTYVSRGSSPGAHRVVISVEAEVPIESGANSRPADVVFVAKSARDGKVVASGTDVMSRPRTAAMGLIGTARYHVQFVAPPGDYLMRVVVREPAGGVVGSVDRRFAVNYFDGTDVTASDLMIGRKSDALPVRAEGYAGEALTGMLEIYAREPKTLDAVEVAVALLDQDGEARVRFKADMNEIVRAPGSISSRTASIELPLGGVPAGEYRLRATVKAKGETVADCERAVVVRAGAPQPSSGPESAAPSELTPTDILDGEVAQRFVASLGQMAGASDLKKAAGLAAGRSWDGVAGAVSAAAANTMAGRALRGMGLFAKRQYADAVVDLQAALDLDPKSAVTAFLLGWAQSATGNQANAITAWRAATVASPTLVPAYLALAEAYLGQSQQALALQVLRAGLAALPKSVELQSKIAEVERR